MAKVLVTGAAGFVGSHLVESLLSDGHEVLAVDNFSTGSRKNLQPFFQNPNFEFLRHDVTSPLFVEVDGIFNLASPASPRHYQKDPVQTMKTNVLGAINALGLAKRLGCRIFQASTSEIYGDPEVNPQVESYWGHVNSFGVRACYDESKRAAETLFFDYNRQHKVDVRIARIFNTYGPKMAVDDGRVVSNFIVQALRGDPLTIYGDGGQTRAFMYVSDLIAGIKKLYNSNASNSHSPVNLGNPNPCTMLELASLVLKITGSKSRIIFEELPSDDPKNRKPDIGKATQMLNWEPEIDLALGLSKTIEYFEGELNNGNFS